MRNEGDPLAPIAIPGWGMAIILVLIIAVMFLIFRAMMRRMKSGATTPQPVPEPDVTENASVDDNASAKGEGGTGANKVEGGVAETSAEVADGNAAPAEQQAGERHADGSEK